MMTYQQTLDYIFSRLPMFSRVGSQAMKSGFANILMLCRAIGQPQTKCKYVHVAGTNGKGSVSHLLASVLQTAGYRTGLYTSPHLKDLRERIKINGREISETAVIDFIDRITPSIETIHPSFFEITVAMAFDHFAMNHCDIAVIETGLGGRLDSTNIISPEVSVITNIAFDHVHILGDTLAQIALEKAHIIKPGTPVVIGQSNDETDAVFLNFAKKNAAEIYFADRELFTGSLFYEDEMLVVPVTDVRNAVEKKYKLDLPGTYQTKNLITTLCACHLLQQQGWKISDTDIEKGLRYAKKITGLRGRWQTIQQHPRVVLDVAHNPDGMKQVVQQLNLTPHGQLHIVLGMVTDKDVDAVLKMLPANARYYFTNAHVPRAMAAAVLQQKAVGFGLQGAVFDDVNAAIKTAKATCKKDDLILVCGSVFVVGEVDEII